MEGLRVDGTFKGARKLFHFLSGTGVVVTAVDSPDTGDNEVEVTFAVGSGMPFSVGGDIVTPSATTYVAWRAPYAATVTAVRGYADVGTTSVINASKVGTGNFCSSNLTLSSAATWMAGTVNQNTSIAVGDTIGLVVATVGTATAITIQVELTRA